MLRASAVLPVLAAALLAAVPASAQDKVKIGVVVTLSGPSAVLGAQARDGFNLAVKTLGGKLGGLEAEVIVADDELKPDQAVTKVKGLIDRDNVDFVVGPIFSNVLQAIHKPVTDSARAILISPNAGTSNFAGKQCNPNFFVTSYQNDQVHEVLGKYAQDKGYKSVVLMAPNYQAGKDSLAGFKRHYKGQVLDEMFTPLGQLDFSAELTKIAAAKPEAFFTFMPGGMGVNLVRQYRQAGLAAIPFLSAFTTDESTLPAQKDDAIGFLGGANWAPDMNNPQSKAFVAAFEAAYGSVPGTYAMQAYDAALLIDSAIKGAGGKVGDRAALTAAMKKAAFTSLRGKFRFGNNNYPIQDFYLVKVAKRADGKYQTEIAEKVFADYVDAHAGDCPMK
ncbi:ABC transporter substrate-binding protein [Prosthecomicrobium hirschii]|uniref:ABC transporter substrate-binding protein n=1 Tax=Prosthecodimorpha hirschii TaxID=665126 RepID=UPI0022210F71|nr:ABC transporter substrate-binding protein [Prosthecomicrobium hirschii]MCW1840839.1 ABC transporter substrate-binding protein [Prosthecomicrobium hirschii]